MCRKLETEEEKVVPFYSSSLSAEEEEKSAEVEAEPPTEPLAKVRCLLMDVQLNTALQQT